MSGPTIDLSFSHRWQAEILPARPLILPPRRYVYPRDAEEVERGALEVRAVHDPGLLVFVGHHSILAWSANGQAWDSGKLSDEGVTITAIESGVLRGLGWEMLSDRERPFAVDLRTGQRL